MNEGPRYIEERLYFPDGCDPDDEDAPSFQVGVFYRGGGRYAVATSRECHRQLSSTGRWLYLPAKVNALRWCRFDFEEACRRAEAAVNVRKVNGRTWSEWEAATHG